MKGLQHLLGRRPARLSESQVVVEEVWLLHRSPPSSTHIAQCLLQFLLLLLHQLQHLNQILAVNHTKSLRLACHVVAVEGAILVMVDIGIMGILAIS